MVKLIRSLEKEFNFFKQPERIGDIIDYKDHSYLIIGIECVRFYGRKLRVMYTCQRLDMAHALQPEVQPFDNYKTFYANVDVKKHYDDADSIFSSNRENLLKIGRVFEFEGHYYRWITYTDLEFEFTTLKVSGLAQPVYPVTTSQARRTLMDHKRKKLDLALIR